MAPQSRQVKNAIFSAVHPTSVSNPKLVSYSSAVLELLGIHNYQDDGIIKVRPRLLGHSHTHSLTYFCYQDIELYLSGNKLLPGSDPMSHCYCGHQFGSFAGQLGRDRLLPYSLTRSLSHSLNHSLTHSLTH